MKKLLSIFLIVCVLFSTSGVYALPQGSSLKATEPYLGVLNRAWEVGGGTGVLKYVKFTDINSDGTEEMLGICTTNDFGASVAAYLFSYTGSDVEDYKLADLVYFNDFSTNLGGVDIFAQNGNCIVRDSTYLTGVASGFDPPHTVMYNELSVNDDGKIVQGIYDSYFAEGGYLDADENSYEQATPENEKKAIISRWEKGNKISVFAFGERDYAGCPKLVVDSDYMSREQAVDYLRNKRDNMIKESYSGFSEVTSSYPDEDKAAISKLLSNFYVRDRKVYALLGEDELIELAYEILADTTLEDYIYPVDTFPVNAGGCLEVYNTDDVEDLIYSLTGCGVDYRTHTCLEERCTIRDQELHTWVEVGQDVLDKVKNRDLVVIHTSEMGEYPAAQIKNIFEISSDKLLVLYDYTFYDPVYTYAVVGKRFYGGRNEYYMIEQGGKDFADSSYFNKYVEISREPSNVSIDYSAVGKYSTPEQYVEYLKTLISGVAPNDSAKEDIAKYIEYAIKNSCTGLVEVKGKKAMVTADDVLAEIEKAEKLRSDGEKVLAENGITLNKALKIELKLDTSGGNLKRGITVEFDNKLSELAGRFNGITVILDENRQSVGVLSSQLAKTEGACVKIRKDGKKYVLQFMDANGEKIQECGGKFTFAFESGSEYNTVLYEKDNEKNIWGGINDMSNKLIEFMTSYSGTYYVEENMPDISDIDGLTDEEKEAVLYMVSRGYFTLENGCFNPYGSLSRYDFTKILVGIFYAMDYNAECTFDDVSNDNPYYDYIASSQKEEIVKGYEDNTFKGNKNASREEVISVASRTLAGKKEYSYPQNTDEYIQFVDNEEITGWENQYGEIALAVREGLIDKGGILAPRANITRVDAAVILYRLYVLLYGDIPAKINTNTTSSAGSALPVAAACGAGIAIAGGVAVFVLRKRKLKAVPGIEKSE